MTGFNIHQELTAAEAALVGGIESKVKASATAATVVGLIASLLGLYVFHGALPDWATAVVGAAVTGGLTFAAGWLTKHTPRTVPAPVAPVTPAPVVPPVVPPGV